MHIVTARANFRVPRRVALFSRRPMSPGKTSTRHCVGLRGFRKANSLAKLLAKHRGRRNRKQLPPYTSHQILKWAKSHHERTGQWPLNRSGSIPEAPGETWMAVDMALRTGNEGCLVALPCRSCLPAKNGSEIGAGVRRFRSSKYWGGLTPFVFVPAPGLHRKVERSLSRTAIHGSL